jgi:oligopeptide/dipeptide ABC transporter ATP-binding protein
MTFPRPLLAVEALQTSFKTESGKIRVLDGVSFYIKEGETLGVVGESGCGKSITALSIMRLLPLPAGHIDGGKILFDGVDLLGLPIEEMYKIRGHHISMIFQEPMTALNPVIRVEDQLAESYHLHFSKMDDTQIHQNIIDGLEKVGISDPASRAQAYPHQLSGGIRQRVMIAMALAHHPRLLIADEPTTALDVTIQAQILALIKERQRDLGMALMLITHDLGVVAQTCDRIAVMYSGRIVETADTQELFRQPKHPYTLGLLQSIPRLDRPSKKELKVITGMVPDLYNLPAGCRFHPRCPFASEVCRTRPPESQEISSGHHVACFNQEKVHATTS